MRKNFENYLGLYSLKKDWVFPYSEVPKDSVIILYGAGDVGQAYYEQISINEYCKIKHWVDRDFHKFHNTGLPVENPKVINEAVCDYIVIAVADASVAKEINEKEISGGFPQDRIVWVGNERKLIKAPIEGRILSPLKNRIDIICRRRNINQDSSEVAQKVEQLYKFSEEKLILPRIVVEITSACTLCCKKCNNLMPLYRNSLSRTLHCSKEDVIKDIDKLMSSVDVLLTMELIGGEPFTHPEFLDILRHVLLQKNIIEIEITTNGTIIPSKELLIEMQNNKVVVKISEYKGIKTDILISKLSENAIHYEIERDLLWIDSGNTEKRGKSRPDLRRNYALCVASYNCKTLYKGKMYACARTANLFELGLCAEPDGYVDIHEVKDLKREIRSFFLKQEDPGCDYCDFAENWRQIPAGEQ